MKRYEPKTIEAKWQKVWQESKLYEANEDESKRKIYATPMLPYPSGSGLHVGHVRNYSISDTLARFYRQRGYNVMSNIGWDSFGLPAENYAIKTGTPPWVTTKENIANFRKQLKRLGMSFAWDREINTSDPEYYKWTQWIFNQLLEAGLAYQAKNPQWWCPKCKTVLANEQVVNGKCWRHEDTKVIKKELNQWFFKITEYADELLEAIDDLDWPSSIRSMQTNWIGRSVGAEVDFRVEGSGETLKVFTTRPDTLFGATFMVLAPEHPLVEQITTQQHEKEIMQYVEAAVFQDNIERMDESREKTGVFTGGYAINPVNNEKIPIWIADYVLMGYGTGAIMAVPAHDQRDWEFAKKFGLDIGEVFKTDGDVTKAATEGEGRVINSGEYDGLSSAEMREKIVSDLSKKGLAQEKVNYKIHDWLISRQRYWGAPIPVIHCEKCGAVPVPDEDLPVELPRVEKFEPTGGATSVLAEVEDWVNVECPKCGASAKRETDTMDGYACSSWYMHRYTDAKNDKQAWDPKKLNYWFPVDFYFGGDHAVSHLLYFRFWNRFFHSKGLVNEPEPVKKLVYNGYINAEDGSKMSKSKGNVVDPLDIIDSGYGADALRMFELFIGPYDQDASWNTNGVPGTYRFLQRVWALVEEYVENDKKPEVENQPEKETLLLQAINRTIKKVTDDLDRLSFNTAVAGLMEFVNSANKIKEDFPIGSYSEVWREALSKLIAILAPFAPHIASELWQELGMSGTVHKDSWPTWDEEMIKLEIITFVVQVNGKVRANIEVIPDTDEKEIVEIAKKDENVAKYLEAGEILKTIVVPQKLINFVIRQ